MEEEVDCGAATAPLLTALLPEVGVAPFQQRVLVRRAMRFGAVLALLLLLLLLQLLVVVPGRWRLRGWVQGGLEEGRALLVAPGSPADCGGKGGGCLVEVALDACTCKGRGPALRDKPCRQSQ